MKLRDYRQELIKHLESISDEDFEKELFLAGIENQESTIIRRRDFILNPEIQYTDTTSWGVQFYGQTRDDVVEVCFNGEAA